MAKTKTNTKTKGGARPSSKAASRKPKSSSARCRSTQKGQSAGGSDVKIDRRRGSRREAEPKTSAQEAAAPPVRLERRKKVNRRRQIDPTTCERDYTEDEIQFMSALDEYKRTSGRMFPTCSEVLEVVRGLGYVRLSAGELATRMPAENSVDASLATAEVDEESPLENW